ncbi:salivary plasminogen activator gamma-like [Xenopus laevis]|uniref:Salivary plasminogen activator gamma-like n=1 Tax=Xenopus laevis TaxID=8355 RepID=A0A8J1MPK8_XENLA|nr:salivary plasminogen activator gamma-like [Xenopus laevis]
MTPSLQPSSSKAPELRVIIGRTLRTQQGDEEQEFTVDELHLHPEFDSDTYDNDIALLNLHSTSGSCAKETESTRPACIPDLGLTLPDWTECEISGYGKPNECKKSFLLTHLYSLLTFSILYSDQLKEGHVRLYPYSMCISEHLSDHIVTKNMLFAGDTRNLDDACKVNVQQKKL